jgi:molybdenum cofactor cytidylyltransferase
MGMQKLSLPYDHERTFYEKCVQTFLQWGCRNIISIVNEEGYTWLKNQKDSVSSVTIVKNNNPQRGRFSSLQLGVHDANKDAPVFIHNIDNPFITIETLQKIFQKSIVNRQYDFISPRYKGRGGHPILISCELAEAIRSTRDTNISLNMFLSGYTRTDVDVEDPGILSNINTMEDYTRAGLSLD